MAGLVHRVHALPQSLRFLFAGGFSAGVNWLVRFPLSAVLPFWLAVAMATSIGMAVGFVLYQSLVFPHSRRPLPARLRDFVLVNLATSVVAVGVAAIANQALAAFMPRQPGEALAHALGIAVGAILNFTGHRAVTFGDARRPAPILDRPC